MSSVAARLDRLPITRAHRVAVVIVGVGMFFDLYEVFLSGTLGSVLTTRFGIVTGSTEQKLLLSSAFIGAFFGALALTRLADRLGRRRAFFLTLGIYSFFSILAAFSPNVQMLVVCRFLAGVGIGGELPLCDAYLSDLLPARVRGRLIGWAYTVGFCAIPAVGFLARGIAARTNVLGTDGWRWMFVIGGVGAAICWALRRRLPESPRWLEAVGRHDEADAIVRSLEEQAERQTGQPLPTPDATVFAPSRRAPVSALFRPPWRTRTIMLWLFHCLQTFGYYGFGTLVPLVLAAKGFDLSTGLAYSAVTFLGYPVGSLVSVPILERVERRTLVIASAVAMIGFGLLFGYSNSEGLLLTAGFLYTTASNVFSNGYHVYQGELYPTSLRATGAGSAYSLSRLATAVMPFVLLPLLEDHGSGPVFICISIALLLVIADIAILGPRTTGRSVEAVAGAESVDGHAGILPTAHTSA